MSTFAKPKLKAAREAIGKKDWTKARDTSAEVLEYEPDNYHAHVFLGLSCFELGEYQQSEQYSRKAIELNRDQPLAWQGLVKLYERTERWDDLHDTVQALADLWAKSKDAVKCAENLQKLVDLRRDHGSSQDVVTALSNFLPDSPYYDTLSLLPPPDPTNPTGTTTFFAQSAIHNSLPILEEIVELSERAEENSIEKEIEKRRTRLGASSAQQLRLEVGREYWSISKLPRLYTDIINHPNTSDELRRATESKLLRHKQRYLFALPSSGDAASTKSQLAEEVQDLVNGAVLLEIPDELAWELYIASKDVDTLEAYDFALFRRFMCIFPSSDLTKLLQGFFAYAQIPPREEGDDEAVDEQPPEEDPYDTILDAFTSLNESVLAHRILCEVYTLGADHENAIRASESGLELVGKTEQSWGKKFPQTRKAFRIALATALVHFYPPKHHARALGILDDVLAQDPDNVPCLMGRGYVMQYAGNWEAAGSLFERVTEVEDEHPEHGLRAREEHAWCRMHLGDASRAAEALQVVLDSLDHLQEHGQDQARCWWRLGQCIWHARDGDKDVAYRHFITALKRSSTFAPAFTSLGIYYSEYASPPDPTRASKCFQKAFELDARESDAAHRLAQGFAEEREWDLVEVVARRTIAGEGGLGGGIDVEEGAAAARHLPTNVWAWKAVGIVELTRRNYPAAIQALQTALRAHQQDHTSWLRLGDAYYRAGRYAAASKALARAKELCPDDWMCSFFIGEVQRQTGFFREAVDSFESVLEDRPEELGVLMALAQTYLDRGLLESSSGFISRAEESCLSAIKAAQRAIECGSGFRHLQLKIIGDALYHLSSRPAFTNEQVVRPVVNSVHSLVGDDVSERISGFVASNPLKAALSVCGVELLESALFVYDHRLDLGFHDDASAASAWCDQAVACYKWGMVSQAEEQRNLALKRATASMTEAVKADPGNDTYWNLLACMSLRERPKFAQNAYIRALEIDNKNPVTWTHLGLLYLYHGDAELANEALYRAQTLDPDYTLAWVGQGLVATANGHDTDARALFEHINNSLTPTVVAADLEYASRTFELLSRPLHGRARSTEEFVPVFFALDRYCKRRPEDASALHLFGLVCERIGHIELAVELVTRSIEILEGIYEDTEDATVERQFVIANTTLGRMRVATGNFPGALESFETAQALVPLDSDDRSIKILRCQCDFGRALAYFNLGHHDDALASFQTALQISGGDREIKGHVSVLLSQALWALGSTEFQETAKNHLLQSIAEDPEDLTAINTLAGMGIVSEDSSLVDAALSELLSMSLDKRQQLDPGREVPYLLLQHHLGQNDVMGAISLAQAAVVAEPTRPELKRNLSVLTLQQGDYSAALALLPQSETETADESRKSTPLRAVAVTLAGEDNAEARRLAQKAVMLSPADKRSWEVLALHCQLHQPGNGHGFSS
ncbi:superkiller protein 3 SKI3 [Punctularia strigosozonata HHB-11173 SS5]|uniref:superkiller protein 3 SKI3 n=1 Tax=Punctularia strigosozonata (strain HHB-11173) TaxID=741275 RepID=UPI00044165F5|nr:superkiller protein 3 SKI3 [Punctularia strigosozonata HHB-11173 SS5]EIN11575.1 superkiller protein 3 SKI3 [Punctularia strigosozonata HHB-11173 SS5]